MIKAAISNTVIKHRLVELKKLFAKITEKTSKQQFAKVLINKKTFTLNKKLINNFGYY